VQVGIHHGFHQGVPRDGSRPNIGGAMMPPRWLASKNAGLSSLYARAYFCSASRVTFTVTVGYLAADAGGVQWHRLAPIGDAVPSEIVF